MGTFSSFTRRQGTISCLTNFCLQPKSASAPHLLKPLLRLPVCACGISASWFRHDHLLAIWPHPMLPAIYIFLTLCWSTLQKAGLSTSDLGLPTRKLTESRVRC